MTTISPLTFICEPISSHYVNTPTNIFITKWQSLFHQSKINPTMGVWLLENKMSPQIWFKLFHTNTHKTTINKTLTKIRKIIKAFKAYTLFLWGALGESSEKSNAKKYFGQQMETKDPQEADNAQINAFTSESKKPNVKGMKCFNCEDSRHGVKECHKPKNECPDCCFLGDPTKRSVDITPPLHN